MRSMEMLVVVMQVTSGGLGKLVISPEYIYARHSVSIVTKFRRVITPVAYSAICICLLLFQTS